MEAVALAAQGVLDDAGLDAIARASGVSVPVVYDHFESKEQLHRQLLERHRDELLATLGAQPVGDGPPERSIPRMLDAWFGYVEEHPHAWRMLFRDTTGEMEDFHRAIHGQARARLAALLTRDQAQLGLGLRMDETTLEMVSEAVRGGDGRPGALVARPPRGAAGAPGGGRDGRPLAGLRPGARWRAPGGKGEGDGPDTIGAATPERKGE